MIRDDKGRNLSLYCADLLRHDYSQVGNFTRTSQIIGKTYTFRFLRLLLIISFSLGAGGEKCRRTGILEVKPANSSHLILRTSRVSEAFEVSNLSATVESYAEGDKTFELDIDAEGNAFIPTDPCFPYKVHVSASVGNESHSLTEKISVTFNYNLRTSDRYPFNNELKNEVIDKICLVRSDVIRIPEPPASLKSCVFTKGDRLFFGKSATNTTSGHVEFEIVDPASDFKNPKRICIRTLISELEQCSKNATESQRKNTKLRFFNVDMEVCRREGNMPANKGSIVTSQVPQIVGIAVSVLVAIAAVVCIVCWKMKRNRSVPQKTENTDENNIYGTYSRGWYGEGDYGDGDRNYVTDTNDYYA